MKKTIIITVLMAVSASAKASDWREFWSKTENGSKLTYSYENDTASKYKGGAKAWIQSMGEADRNESINGCGDFSYRYNNEQWTVDCSNRTIGVLGYAYYTNDGQMQCSWSSKGRKVSMEEVIPDSVGEAFWKLACRPGKKKAK